MFNDTLPLTPLMFCSRAHSWICPYLKYFQDGIQNIEANTIGFYVAITNNTNKPLIKYEGFEINKKM